MMQRTPVSAKAPVPKRETTRIMLSKHPLVVRLYTRLYAARFGFVSHPHPLGAWKPSECRKTRFSEVRAAIRFVSDGLAG